MIHISIYDDTHILTADKLKLNFYNKIHYLMGLFHYLIRLIKNWNIKNLIVHLQDQVDNKLSIDKEK